jgi:hypothetical protein
MPFSYSAQLSTIIGHIEQLNPASILDVGAGMGQYGFLLRTNLENIHLFEINGAEGKQRPKSEWRVRIDGIEGCAAYLTPVHEYAYNQIFLGDALAILPTLADNAYELVIAIDILEHFTIDDGALFLTQLQRIAWRQVLVSTPKEFLPQEIAANPYENHRSHWTEEDLRQYGFKQILDNPFSWIALWQNPHRISPAC